MTFEGFQCTFQKKSFALFHHNRRFQLFGLHMSEVLLGRHHQGSTVSVQDKHLYHFSVVQMIAPIPKLVLHVQHVLGRAEFVHQGFWVDRKTMND